MRKLWKNACLYSKEIGVVITAIILLVGCVAAFVCYLYGLSGPWVFSEEYMTVKTDASERKATVVIAEVLKEKDKEDLYYISFVDAEWNGDLACEVEFTETEYNKYIGEGNNCITYKYGYCTVTATDKFDWKKRSFVAERWCFPWENTSVEFADEEAASIKEVIIEKHGSVKTSDLPFRVNDFDC